MKRALLPGLLMTFAAASAWAVAEPESVSLQDLKPECRERHSTIPPEQCMIQDGVLVRQYVRRFNEPVLVMPAPPPATTERIPAGTPAIIHVIPVPR